MSTLPPERLKEALREETLRFETFYRWLEKSMPRVFFKEVDPEWISLIVHGLMRLKEQGFFSEIHIKNVAIALCIDSPESDIQILKRYPLYGIKNYTTYISREPLPFTETMGRLRIAITYFTEASILTEEELPSTLKEPLKNLLTLRNPAWSEEKSDLLIKKIDPRFLRKIPTERQAIAVELFEQAQMDDLCQYVVQYAEDWQEKGIASMYMLLAWKNVPKHHFLYRLARLVYRYGLVMEKLDAVYTDPYKTDSIFMLSFSLHGKGGHAAWESTDITEFLQELVILKYFGSADLIDSTFVSVGRLRGIYGNFLRTSIHFIHQILVQIDPNLYSLENIEEGICRHPELTIMLCEVFEYKFHPEKNNLIRVSELREEFLQLVQQIDTGHEHNDQRRKNILLQGMNFITYTLKTNFYCTNKTALAFRLDPSYLDHAPFEREKFFPELPFGIIFIKGMHFLAFHIRFKDLSRGGLRTVFPEKKERMLAERNTVFNECYSLAYTQHKKNKDIPEGGSKAIIFLKPYERLTSEAEILSHELMEANLPQETIEKKIEEFKQEQTLEYLYQTQRSFINTLLTLVNCHPDGTLRAEHIIDYWRRPEYIYLGPDENMHDSMIEWIANKSKKEHYRPGGAFISGKPKIGINHKEYGVTSLTVNVCMVEVLKFLGIDPKRDLFTVKMTGGPDGDVAGNQILNLYRYYKNTAKLVALTDVSGTIYDPLGLDLEACVELFRQAKPIRFYPPEKLSPGAFLLDREKRRESGPYMHQTCCWQNKEGKLIEQWLSGNEMNSLFHNNVHQTKADIFIPCGGRPKTLRDTNCKTFLDLAGAPTARAIIEGANLYLSPFARQFLENHGVLIIKDSSANKGGVICSSFEIICGLTLNDKEFLDHKAQLVQEILERLHQCALDEAKLLLTAKQETAKPLTELSDEISKRINYFTDQLLGYLEGISLPSDPENPLNRCFLSYCLKILREQFRDRLIADFPENHKKAIIASHIASKLVYRRGLQWFPTLIDILPLLLNDDDLLSP